MYHRLPPDPKPDNAGARTWLACIALGFILVFALAGPNWAQILALLGAVISLSLAVSLQP